MPLTNFKPSKHGFHFANEFYNHIVDIPGHGSIATSGRCGGMAYAALDYYFDGIAIPTHLPEDFSPGRVPADGTRLSDYIYRRLFRSIFDGGIKWVTWTLCADQDTFVTKGVTRLTKEEELPKLRREIDTGTPVALGLIVATNLADIGHNHQVVAYGYDYDATVDKTVIYIYDNNFPDRDDTVLIADSTGPHLREEVGGEVVATWRGLFIQNYERETPQYKDIMLAKDIWVSSSIVSLSQSIEGGFTVKNGGDYAAHCRQLRLHLTDPDGQVLDHFLASYAVDAPLFPSEEREVSGSFNFPGEKAGTYRLSAVYYSVQGDWLNIPTADSPAAEVDVQAQRASP